MVYLFLLRANVIYRVGFDHFYMARKELHHDRHTVSLWEWLKNNAVTIASLVAIGGLIIAIVALIVSICSVNSTITNFESDMAYKIEQESSELKIVDSNITIKPFCNQPELNGTKVNTTRFITYIWVVNSVSARYPARIIGVDDTSYISESDGKVALDLGEEDEIRNSGGGMIDWEEPHTKLVYPGEVYSVMRIETEVFEYGNYTLVIRPNITYYDPFTEQIEYYDLWLYEYGMDGGIPSNFKANKAFKQKNAFVDASE